MTCYLNSGDDILASTVAKAVLNGVTNPPTGTDKLTVSTSSDTKDLTSPAYTITGANPVNTVTLPTPAPTSAAGGLTTYIVGFTTSSTGALDSAAGSTVTIGLPANTGLNSLGNSSLNVGSTQVGYCRATDISTATPTVTCYLYSGDDILASTVAKAVLNGVANPPIGTDKLTVSTSSDTGIATSPAYTITGAGNLATAAVAVSKTLVSPGSVTYTIRFTTSSTGALDSAAGGTVTIDLPANTGLSSLGNSPLNVGSTQVGYCSATNTSTATPTVTCYLYSGDDILASTAAAAVLSGVKNPPTTRAYVVHVSTSSDVHTRGATYCIATATAPCLSGVTPNPAKAGTTVTFKGLNLATVKSVVFSPSKKATVTAHSSTRIVVKVPVGTKSGPVKVTTTGGSASVSSTI